MTAKERESFEQLLERLGIEQWDLVLVGDGSGSKWGYPCGWATVALERNSMERTVFYGAMSQGTVNFAEMMAYLQPLSWYLTQEKTRRAGGGKPKVYQIHIITDSDYCKSRGQQNDLDFKNNQALWAVFELFQRQGFRLNWHWVPRESVELNRYVDRVGRQARLLLQNNDVVAKYKNPSVYDHNPWS